MKLAAIFLIPLASCATSLPSETFPMQDVKVTVSHEIPTLSAPNDNRWVMLPERLSGPPRTYRWVQNADTSKQVKIADLSDGATEIQIESRAPNCYSVLTDYNARTIGHSTYAYNFVAGRLHCAVIITQRDQSLSVLQKDCESAGRMCPFDARRLMQVR